MRQNVRARRNLRISARRNNPEQNPWVRTLELSEIACLPILIFELKRLKLKLDIAKKPENRVHELTDSNVSRPRGGAVITLVTYNCSNCKLHDRIDKLNIHFCFLCIKAGSNPVQWESGAEGEWRELRYVNSSTRVLALPDF